MGYVGYPACWVDTSYPFPATLTVTPLSGAVTTLFASDLQVLKWRVEAQGGNAYVAKMAVGTQFSGSGSWQVTGQTLYKNSAVSTATLTRFGGLIVIVSDASEDVVSSGAYNDYWLYLTISGAGSAGDTLTVTLLEDSVPSTGLVGPTGYVYNPLGDSLYGSAGGLCGAGDPNFVWTGAASHTMPTPACGIASYGTPDYADGSLIGSWTVTQNTLTAP